MRGLQVYSEADMQQSIERVDAHLQKLRALSAEKKWPEVNRSIRAIEDECRHALHVGGALAFADYNQNPQRFTRGKTGDQS